LIAPQWQRLDTAARSLAPFSATVLLLILGLVPLRLPYVPPFGTSLVMVSVYYWAIHRPAMLPAPAVFAIGLLADLFGGGMLGLGALILLLAYVVAESARRWIVGANFAIVWLGYAVLEIASVLLSWLLTKILTGSSVALAPGLSGAMFGVGAYPLLATLFARAQRGLLR
jgi:rod shape-determining protein MreD